MSDHKFWDVFRDPLWLLHNLYDKYKVIRIPTGPGWISDHLLTGGYDTRPAYINVYTGITANSRGMGYARYLPLNSGNYNLWEIDFTKRLELHFILLRGGSDTEAVGRVQLKSVITEGALAAKGLGLRVDNFSLVGEAYGTALGTAPLGALTNYQSKRIKVVLVPGVRVEFWVEGILQATLTGTAVPTGQSTDDAMVISIINGATGGVNAFLYVFNIQIVQAW